MAKTSESGGWDQDPPGSGRAGSTFVTRTPSSKQVVKTEIVRDDWDDDDDEEEEEQVDVGKKMDVNGDTKAMAMVSGTRNDGTAPAPGLSGKKEKDAEERKGEEDSSKIWEEANKRAPMPELIVARASTSQSFPPPPPAALQPTLRILKRPSPSTSLSPNNAGAVNVSSTSLSSSSPGPTSGSGSGSGGTSPAPRTLAEREAQYQEARSRIFGEKEKSGSASANVSSDGVGVVVVRDPLGPAPEPELEPGMSGHGPGGPAKGFGERRRGKK